MDERMGRLTFADKVTSLTAFGASSNVRKGNEHHTDTTLRLESPGSSSLVSSSLSGVKRKWGYIGRKVDLDCTSLSLGLRLPSSSSDSSRRSAATLCTLSSMRETDEESVDLDFNFQLHLGNESTPMPRDCSEVTSKAFNNELKLDLQLSLSVGGAESVITSMTPVQLQHQKSFQTSANVGPEQSINEGSSSSCSKYENHHLRHLYTSEVASGFLSNKKIVPSILGPDLPLVATPTPKSPVACTSGITLQRDANTKKCQFEGCTKGARGASGLCIAHGGGRRCQKDGCQKGAEGRTIYCKAHGGGRRCELLGCTKSAEGRTDHCISHGGGRRCSHEDCTKAARGKSGFCIRHGGGKRCQMENCPRSAEDHTGLCISHGGGRRCQYKECSKGAQGRTMFCKAHGGGKRCTFSGCSKGAEGSTPFCKGHGGGKRCTFQDGCGKSVHGGTQFCVAHGGGKRCAVPDCTKSARGRSDFCVRHGGGKRCISDGCGKSAQGSTDYCKAHGGGKRCLWGRPESELVTIGPPCNRFARAKSDLCASHSALVQDQCVHDGALLESVSDYSKLEKMKGIAFEDDNVPAKINPMKFMHHVTPLQASMISLPEGRVHGGSLLAMMATSETPAKSGTYQTLL